MQSNIEKIQSITEHEQERIENLIQTIKDGDITGRALISELKKGISILKVISKINSK